MDNDLRRARSSAEQPAHPTLKANLLMLAVVLAVVVLAAMDTFGHR